MAFFFLSQAGFVSPQPGTLNRLIWTTTPVLTVCAQPPPLGDDVRQGISAQWEALSLCLALVEPSVMPQVHYYYYFLPLYKKQSDIIEEPI